MKTLAVLLAFLVPWQEGPEKKIKERQDFLSSLVKKAKTTQELSDIGEECLMLADEACAQNLYDASVKIAAEAERVARLAKNQGLAERAQSRALELKGMRDAYMKARDADLTLSVNPNDPEAATVFGRFLCFVKGDWENGVRALYKGNDVGLRAVSEKELSGPALPEDQIAVGNAWWDLAKKARQDRPKLMQRAAYWYEKAWDGLSRADRIPLRAKVEQVLQRPSKGDATEGPVGWTRAGVFEKLLHLSDLYARSGKYSVVIQAPPEESKGGCFFHQTVVPEPGAVYEASAWVLTEGDVVGVFGLRLPESAAGTPKNAYFPKDRPFWTRLKLEIEAPPDAKGLQAIFILYPSGKDGKGRVWVDDVSVKKLDSPRELVDNGSFERK